MKSGKAYQIGHLYVDGRYVCDTIEDIDRGLTQQMTQQEIAKVKVYSKTAIPRGKYRVTMSVKSPKFAAKAYYRDYCKGLLPRLLDVPGFDGILIHKGSTERDSAGCIIVGWNTAVGKVTSSQKAFETLYPMLRNAADKGERIYIEIIKSSGIGV